MFRDSPSVSWWPADVSQCETAGRLGGANLREEMLYLAPQRVGAGSELVGGTEHRIRHLLGLGRDPRDMIDAGGHLLGSLRGRVGVLGDVLRHLALLLGGTG